MHFNSTVEFYFANWESFRRPERHTYSEPSGHEDSLGTGALNAIEKVKMLIKS